MRTGDDPQHAWQVLYPAVACHDSGWLDVGDGHHIHWQVCGHPGAPAALFLHGGPGAGCTPGDRRWFDPQRWRIVLFDQRGCGRSRAVDPLHANTTGHLVADIEALRQHLVVDRWLLFGGSWGATLALAYAQQHTQRVIALVLRGVFTARAIERRWLYGAHGAALRHPAAWQRLLDGVGLHEGSRKEGATEDAVLSGLRHRLRGSDGAARLAAARAWWRWEQDLMDAESAPPVLALPTCEDEQVLAMAEIGLHYALNAWFLAESQLLDRTHVLRHTPGVIVQGHCDLVTPASTALALHRNWPGSEWRSVVAAGHASSHPAVTRELVAATDRSARHALTPTTGDKNHGYARSEAGCFAGH